MKAEKNTLVYHPDEPLSKLVKAGEEIPEGWSEKKVVKKKVTKKKK